MRINRRSLLLSGAAAAIFPWLRSAQAATGPVRKLLLFFTPHGTVWPSWRPGGGETNFTWSPILTPLSPHRSRVVIVDGVSLPHGATYYIPHTYTMPALWTGSPIDTNSTLFTRTDHGKSFGWGTGTSVDQAIAKQLSLPAPFPTLELGTYCGSIHPANRMIYSGPGQTKTPLDNPTSAFTSVFSAEDPSAAAAAARWARRQSVLDTVVADLQSRKAQLTATERARLDSHATAVRELEQRLSADAPVCTRPTAPVNVNSETAMDLQSDLVAAAFGCGLTRVASVQLRIADNDNTTYPWVGLGTGGHHSLSHNSSADAQATLAKVYNWYAKRFAYLLDRLAATDDPAGGKVLDNTLVIWGSELGRAYDHNISNVPFIFAGGPTIVRGGRYLNVMGQGKTNHRVLVTALHAMGLTSVQKYGSLDTGSGPLAGILV